MFDHPIERVWPVLRDFNSQHLAVAESHIEDGLRGEQLLALSDRDWISTYCILDSTIPLYRYVAIVRLKRVTDADRTFWHWESTFATPPGRERELTEQVGRNVYEAGFAALTKYLD